MKTAIPSPARGHMGGGGGANRELGPGIPAMGYGVHTQEKRSQDLGPWQLLVVKHLCTIPRCTHPAHRTLEKLSCRHNTSLPIKPKGFWLVFVLSWRPLDGCNYHAHCGRVYVQPQSLDPKGVAVGGIWAPGVTETGIPGQGSLAPFLPPSLQAECWEGGEGCSAELTLLRSYPTARLGSARPGTLAR